MRDENLKRRNIVNKTVNILNPIKWVFKNIGYLLLSAYVFIFSQPVLAALPAPPSSDMPSGNNDWSDTTAAMVYKILGYALIILGVAVAVAVAASLMSALSEYQKTNDGGKFAKIVAMCVFILALSIGVLYYGQSILPSS